ncbi:glycosyltransferase family 2 protein [Leptolyngbya sp. KIOST-1]|uniref:glycosyltransferase family 2 protein n=1 Tax=Leptolyngbya sp. KIOST-1 TaxID=1229172 RepID=UPI0009DFF5CE|nr:glycosyltransferase family 2 protein [Leptolyngbya sp. KIOST-1]
MSLNFSVITPSYNQCQFIEQTILSVLAQSGVEIDYRIFDGGSSDNTLDILARYQDKVRWVSQADGGQADAVNKGIRATSGDIIAWINSDDIYYPYALQKVRRVFEAIPSVQVVYGNAHHIDKEGKFINAYPTEKWNYKRLKERCFLCQPATFFRRQVVNDYGYLDNSLNFCMDYELWLRYGQNTDFFYLPELLAGSRFYQGTKTLGQRAAVHYEINDMMVKKFSLSPERWVLAYASVLIDEQDKTESRDISDPKVQVQRANTFFLEVFKSYRRWRKLMISPVFAWRILRWTGAYINFVKSKFNLVFLKKID